MTFPQDTLPFLQELAAHNQRPWFLENKARYDAVHKALVDFCAAIIDGLAKDDPTIALVEPKKCIYRIYRDLRFSQDKRPYKEHVSFWIPCNGNRHADTPGYYMQIAPASDEMAGGSCLGGGVYVTDRHTTDLLRQEVYYQMDELQAILHDNEFRKYYGSTFWDPTPAKTVSFNFRKMVGGIPADYPYADLLKLRNYVSMHALDNRLVLSDQLLSHCLSAFRATIPLNNFFMGALTQNT